MAGALVQLINFSSSVSSQRNGEPKSKISAQMLCRLQTPAMRMRDFSGLRGANGIDEALIISSGARQTLHSTVASASWRSGNRIAPKAMFERFTEKAIKVINLAQDEARRLDHNFVCTEHILLGLLCEETGIAAKLLNSMGINLQDARVEVEKLTGRGSGVDVLGMPFTPRAKRVLNLSIEEATQLGNNFIGTEHLLLGLLHGGEGVAVCVLESLGADPSKIRIQANPKDKPLPFFERLEELCGTVRATRKNATTAAEVLARREAASQNQNQGLMTNEIDQLVSQNGFNDVGSTTTHAPTTTTVDHGANAAPEINVPQPGRSSGKESKMELEINVLQPGGSNGKESKMKPEINVPQPGGSSGKESKMKPEINVPQPGGSNGKESKMKPEINVPQPDGISGKENKMKQKMDVFFALYTEVLNGNVDKILSANKKEPDPKDVMQCLEAIAFDQRYRRKAYIHLCRNPVDFNMIISLALDERGPTLWDMMIQEKIINQ